VACRSGRVRDGRVGGETPDPSWSGLHTILNPELVQRFAGGLIAGSSRRS